MQQRRRLACVLASLAALAIVGCSGHSPAPGVDPSERNLRLIWTAWFVSKKAPQQAPKQWEDLARYIDDDDPNSVRTSPNDHQPYVIVWEAGPPNLQNAPTDPSGKVSVSPFPIFAYEQTGRDGKRFVINVLGQVSTMTEEQLKKALRAGNQTRTNQKGYVAVSGPRS